MAARDAAPVLPSQAAAGASTTPPTPGGGTHTLHIEYAVWSGSYRLIHTKPGGEREVWRRGIPTVEEARHRARIVEDMLGYEARL